MGRYFNSNLCSSSAHKSLKSHCRVRYAMSLLRTDRHLVRAPPCTPSLRPWQNSRFAKKGAFKSGAGNMSDRFLGGVANATGDSNTVRFYSASNGDDLKTPVGALEEDRNSFCPNPLGGRLGQSFHRLSRHINLYFRKTDTVSFAEHGGLVIAAPECLRRPHGSILHAAGEQSTSEKKDAPQAATNRREKSETEISTKEVSGLQLFHISSLATRFGESYGHVAHHINSMFSQGSAEAQRRDGVESGISSRGANRRQRRKKATDTYIGNSSEGPTTPTPSGQAAVDPHSGRNEGYLQFARHINKYFGVRIKDDLEKKGQVKEGNKSVKNVSAQWNPQTQQGGNLFHSSSSATNFGENYMQMSNHINQYFKGESEEEASNEGIPLTKQAFLSSSDQVRAVTFMDCVRHPTSAIPDLLDSYLKLSSSSKKSKSEGTLTSPQSIANRKFVLSRRQAEEATYGLIGSLRLASSPDALTSCVETLNQHLVRYPSCTALIWQENTTVTLLKQRRVHKHDAGLQAALRETLALIGYVDPVKGRGIRVLSIDGGGTRGVVPLQLLKLLEAETGKKIHQMFDYICGVSTGAVLAFMLGLARFSLEECAEMYRQFGSEVFRQNRLVGTVKMGWSHSYYNTETWEAILQKKLGDRILITTARDELSPKVSAVSAVVNWGSGPKAFVFRNYNHTPGSLSRYGGGSGYQMWQAVRASSAAPGYFQEFTLQSDVHQDGGILLNNPCALAVHESRLLWPRQPFQCVLSLGTGRYDNAKRGPATSTSLRAKISSLICSATDTEGVHTLLDDLLPPDVYFRFNPMLSAEVSLDENRPGVMDQLQRDTQDYLERNRPKLARLCLVLGAERSAASRTRDWMRARAWEVRQRFL